MRDVEREDAEGSVTRGEAEEEEEATPSATAARLEEGQRREEKKKLEESRYWHSIRTHPYIFVHFIVTYFRAATTIIITSSIDVCDVCEASR